MKLSIKQQAFADYYIELGDATKAVIKAGYSKKTARSIGSENLTKPNIKNYISEQLELLKSERIVNQKEVLEFLTAVMRGEYTDPSLIFVGRGIQELINIPAGIPQRIKAAELLGKRYGLWAYNVEADGVVQVVIFDDIRQDFI